MRLIATMLITMASAGTVWASGGVTLSETTFEVQTKASFTWVYEVGPAGLEPGDLLRVHDPVFHGIRWSKWGELTPWWDQCTAQTNEQDASLGLVSVHARRDGARLEEVLLHVSRTNCDEDRRICMANIHQQAETEVVLLEGRLEPGDEVVLGIGDKESCVAACGDADACGVCSNCGFEMPDRAFPAILWPAQLCLAGLDCEELAVPTLEVTSLPQADTTMATVPSQVVAGEPFRLKVAILDVFGNAVNGVEYPITVHAPEETLAGTLSADDGGWMDFSVTIDTPGVHRITVDVGPMRVQTNPVAVLTSAPDHQVLWGDIHVHHGYTYVDPDGRVRDSNHDYGRDVVGLDVVSESQKAIGVELGEEALWRSLQNSCRSYTEPGRYIVMLGFEWMGSFAGEAIGRASFGHHNVYYDSCEAPIGTHDVEMIDSLSGNKGLWSWLEHVMDTHDVRGVSVPHAMRRTGHDFEVENASIQTLAEIYSEWGDNTDFGDAEDDAPGSVQDMMNSGLRLGWIGGSDNHDGWMGNPYSNKYVDSGLGAFVVTEHSREGVFDAMVRRHTYATTGHRPILSFVAEDGEHSVVQGTELLAREPMFRWSYNGTGDVDKVVLWRLAVVDGSLQTEAEAWPGDGPDLQGTHQAAWAGANTVAYWLEVQQWDGELAWSSPIWITRDCGRITAGAQDPFGRCADTSPDTAAPPDRPAPPASAGGGGDSPKTRCACAASGAPPIWWVPLALMAFVSRRKSASRRPTTVQR